MPYASKEAFADDFANHRVGPETAFGAWAGPGPDSKTPLFAWRVTEVLPLPAPAPSPAATRVLRSLFLLDADAETPLGAPDDASDGSDDDKGRWTTTQNDRPALTRRRRREDVRGPGRDRRERFLRVWSSIYCYYHLSYVCIRVHTHHSKGVYLCRTRTTLSLIRSLTHQAPLSSCAAHLRRRRRGAPGRGAAELHDPVRPFFFRSSPALRELAEARHS